MKNIKCYLLGLILVLSFTSVIAEGDGKAPVLYVPTFNTTTGSAQAGTAFILKYGSGYYVVSAQHLIGTAGGLDKDYTGKDLDKIFKSVTLTPLYSGYDEIEIKEFVSIPNAAPITNENVVNDIFISPIKGKIKSTPLTVSNTNPKEGDRVMLYSRVVNSRDYMHPATVARANDDELIYIFDNQEINIRATSGAPIINENYQLIGINLAGGKMADGKMIGFANPVQTITNILKK